ncbi:hypothetical protein [Salinirubrum litoreum]|uniref:PH domain-containing protein n=1 Tax=Salinirubrum litoreum TaxID=1126234 RepID=A0ABD5R771_9EURY|nr:hypothetical protein [Salinirubrum litoreum]
MSRDDSLRFREVQRLREPMLSFVVVTVALLLVVVSIAEPMALLLRGLLLAVGVGAVVLLWVTRLVVEVRPDAVSIRVRPFGDPRVIPAERIERVGRHRHRSATTFGRWGVHLGLGDPPTYNVAGEEGVVLRLADETVIVGTARPADLLAAIRGLDTELAEPTDRDWSLRGRATSLGSVTGDGFVTRSKE